MAQAKGKKAKTPLEAVFAGDLERLRELIESGADVNESDEQTPLVEAAGMGRLDMVEELLKAGADANFGGIYVPLCAAVRGKNVDILKALLKAQPELDAQEEDGSTALMLAAGAGNAAMVKALLEAGADPNVEDEDGNTGASIGAENPSIAEFFKPQTKAAPAAKTKPPKADERSKAFIEAAKEGQLKKIREFLAAGLHVDAPDQYGRTALFEAAHFGHVKVVEALLGAGAAVDAREKVENKTPFLASVGSKPANREVMRLLAGRGAKIDVRDCYDRGAVALASRDLDPGDEAMSEDAKALWALLVELGLIDERAVALVAAAGAGNIAAVQESLNSGVSANAVDDHECTPLYMAVSRQHPDIVRVLLKAGANIHKPTGGDPKEDWTWGGHRKPCPKCGAEFVAILRERTCPKCGEKFDTGKVYEYKAGPPWVVSRSYGHTPLMSATKVSNLEIMNLLLDAGAEVDRGYERVTPLMIACYLGHIDAARLLIKRGANPKAEAVTPDQMKEKISPISIAGSQKNLELVKLLWDSGVPGDQQPTLLVDAARRGDTKALAALLKEGADPNKPDPITRDYALEEAVEQSHPAAVKMLIDAGAKVHPPPARRPPLILCAVWKLGKGDEERAARAIETCRILLAAGARVNATWFSADPLEIAKETKIQPLIDLLKQASAAEAAVGKKKSKG